MTNVVSKQRYGAARYGRIRENHGKASLREKGGINNIFIIASSTGGPRALYELIPAIPADIDAAILIVQHMPPEFTKSIARRLNSLSQIHVKEAGDGDFISQGKAYIAPGGFHMEIKPNGQIMLTTGEPVGGLRPAADVTMQSAAKTYGSRCTGLILTGMGSDGTKGAAMIKAEGGRILAEDESTCVIYGMPRSVAEAGLVDKVVPLHQVVSEMIAACENNKEPIAPRLR